MPVGQAIWLAADDHAQVCMDDLFKWAAVPAAQRSAGIERAERRLQHYAQQERDFATAGFTSLLPALGAMLAASERVDRQIALLRVVEAIRLYAHAHAGQLPESLERISGVPIPTDSMTGTAFHYRLDRGKAVLETPYVPNNQHNGRRYVIEMRK